MSETTAAVRASGDLPPGRTRKSAWRNVFHSARGAFWTYIGIVTAGACALLWMNRHQWFLTEDWVFFERNQPQLLRGDWGAFLFTQYRGHWITSTNVLYEAMYRAFGLRSYIPYLLPTILATCACSALIRVHMRRAGVQPWLATGIAALALFYAFGAEDIAKAWQFQFTGAVAFGLGQLLACDHDGPVYRRDALAVGLGFLSIITSGIGILFLGIVFLSLCLRRRWKAAVVNVAPLLGIYLVWYLLYGHEWGNSEQARLDDAGTVFRLVWHGLSLAVDGLTRLNGTGGIVVVVVAVLAILTRVPATRRGTAPVVALAVGAPLFFLFSATTRLASFELLSDRYLHVGALLLLPVVGVVLTRLVGRSRALIAASVVVLAVLVVANGFALDGRVADYTRINALLKPEVLTMAALPSLTSFPPDATLSEPLLSFVTVRVVERLRRDGAFPPTKPISAQQESAVEADLGLRLVPLKHPDARPTAKSTATLLTPLSTSIAATEPGCVTVDESSGAQALALQIGQPTSLPLKTTVSGQFVIGVEGSSSFSTATKLLDLEPGNYELRVDLRDIQLNLELPDQGSTRVCGVAT